MQYSAQGLMLTKEFEGCRLVAYLDSGGTPTIGYGHIAGVKAGDTCTQEQADQWLLDDIKRVEDQINLDVKVTLSQGEYDAIVDFSFNLGCHALETSTLWRLLMAGDEEGASKQFPAWDHCGGSVIAGLLRRRLAEQAEFNT